MKQASNNTGRRVRRLFRHKLTLEGTYLRFNPETGTVSRPERAGMDVGPFVWISGGSLEECRAVWRREQKKLLDGGFEIVETERY